MWPGKGGGEDCVGEGVWASGDKGMLPADLQRADRYCRWSLGERPCRELGLMCWEGAGEFGVLEAGELFWDEAPTEKNKAEGRKTVSKIEIEKTTFCIITSIK